MSSPAQPSAGHRAIDHTADVAIELWAPDEAGLLIEGARAVIALLTEGAVLHASATRTLELSGLDPEDRLVRWLSEVLYLASSEGWLTTDADLTLTGNALRGTLHGHPQGLGLLRTEIKAVTYHDLTLVRVPGRVRAQVVLDV
ncbi:MAG: archease [Deltaproteobacteria bacterium]|nr:archease [Deltaproteobacteria bacterium]